MSAFWGSFRVEFGMQVQRPTVWFVQLGLSLLVFSGLRNPWNLPAATPPGVMVGEWAHVLSFLMPLGFGVLLADRLVRDRRLQLADLLSSLPTAFWPRLLGKYLGAVAATALPILLVYLAGIGYIFTIRQPAQVAVAALAAIPLVLLPGLLFVGAFALGCPLVMPVPLFQVLFVGYWLWGNGLSPVYGIPSLTGTLLTPAGPYMAAGFFGAEGAGVAHATPAQGLASIALLLGITALALGATGWLWQRQNGGQG